jgi:tripartite-type tricarboxylate transporter receptor subunit TctC
MKKILMLLMLASCSAFAQWQPTKPVTVMIPTTPGSGNEMAARAIFKNIPNINVVIENKPGADGNIMVKELFEAKPDGYTVGIPSCVSAFVFSSQFPQLIKQSPMDLTLIANIGKSPMAFVANSNSKVNTIPELIQAVKTRNVNVGVGGSAHYLAWAYFMDKVGGDDTKVVTVNYKGPNPTIADAAAGVVEFAVVPIAVANTLLPTGKIKLLGIAGETKLEGVSKEVPLMGQYSKGLNVYGCWNVALPPNTPKEIADYYKRVVLTALKTNEYKQFMESNYIFVSKPEDVVADMEALRKQWIPYAIKIGAPN